MRISIKIFSILCNPEVSIKILFSLKVIKIRSLNRLRIGRNHLGMKKFLSEKQRKHKKTKTSKITNIRGKSTKHKQTNNEPTFFVKWNIAVRFELRNFAGSCVFVTSRSSLPETKKLELIRS